VREDYRYSDISTTDIVFDIGANIGGFTLLAAQKAAQVVAVEPIMTTELKNNILLNKLENVIVYSFFLNDGSDVEYTWSGRTKRCLGLPFKTIWDIDGACDFLKSDCEGSEWWIPTHYFTEIPRIEMEMHNFGHPNHKKMYHALLEAIRTTHDYEITPHAGVYGILHASLK
jgi:tRNA G37 N-methylase Trm5